MTRLSYRIKSGLSKKYLLRALREMRSGRYSSAFAFAKASNKVLPNAGAVELAARAACRARMRGNARWAYRKLRGARKRRVAAFCAVRGIDLR
jgi:cytochrome c553